MGKYSFEADQSVESSKARGSSLRAHFKHCREVCHNIKGMKLPKAKAYLEDVLQFKQAVAFTKFTGGCGRHAQGKLRNAAGDKVRWPQKATKIVLDLLKNAEANAEMKGLDVDELVVKHSQANRAQKQRRRTSFGRADIFACDFRRRRGLEESFDASRRRRGRFLPRRRDAT